MQPRSPESTDSTQQYLNEIGQYDLLTAEQEVELGRQIVEGKAASTILADLNQEIEDNERQKLAELAQLGLQAKETFIKSNLRLVVSVAKKQQRKSQFNDLLDLISEGNKGLIRAVEKFDPDKGFKFSTYATWWIKQAITNSIADTNYPIRVPKHYYGKLSLFGNAVKNLSLARSGTPSMEELAEASGLELEEMADLMAIYETQTNLVSLDMRVGGHSKSVEVNDFVPDDNQDVESEALARLAPEEVARLIKEVFSERDAEIILGRFGFYGAETNYTELGKKHGLSRDAVSRIMKNALELISKDERAQHLRSWLKEV